MLSARNIGVLANSLLAATATLDVSIRFFERELQSQMIAQLVEQTHQNASTFYTILITVAYLTYFVQCKPKILIALFDFLKESWIDGQRLDKSSASDVTVLCSIAMNT